MSKRKTLIPLILLLTVVPLIVHIYQFPSGLAQYDWYGTDDMVTDFFLFYKSAAIVLIAAVMCVLLLWHYITGGREFRFSRVWVPLLIYAGLTLLSTLFSPYRYFGFHGAAEVYETLWVLLGYCVTAFYAYQFVRTKEDVDIVFQWLTAGLIIMLFIGILQAAGHDFFASDFGKMLITGWSENLDRIRFSFQDGNQIYLTLYNPNYVSSYFALMIPVEIALLIKQKQTPFRILYAVMLAASFICLIASGNRSGIAVFSVTAVLALILFRQKAAAARRYIFIAAVAVIAIVGISISRNDFIIQKLSRWLSGFSAAEQAISQIVTGEGDVTIDFLGQEFHMAYETDETDTIFVSMYDDKKQEIRYAYDAEKYLYTVQDERFAGFTVQVVRLGEEVALRVNADDRDWYFKKGEDGTYYYYNIFGRWAKIRPIPQAAHAFLERIFEARGNLWSKTIPMLKNCLLLGSGADTYTVTYPQDDYVYKAYQNQEAQIDVKPHSLYLQIATQSGIPALIAFLTFCIWYLVSGLRLYYNASYQDDLELIGAGLLLAVFAYLVISLFNDSTVAVAPIFWIMAGLGTAVNEMVQKKR